MPDDVCRWMSAQHETTIRAPADRVWKALVDETSAWWLEGFNALPDAKGLTIEAHVGGRMYEHTADGSAVVWATVIGIRPGRSLDLAGDLSASFGGPARVLIRFDVKDAGGETTVRAEESRFGFVEPGAAESCAKGWSALLERGLKPHVERS